MSEEYQRDYGDKMQNRHMCRGMAILHGITIEQEYEGSRYVLNTGYNNTVIFYCPWCGRALNDKSKQG